MKDKEKEWDLQYVSWEDYKLALVDGKGVLWDRFIAADLVFGGMDFSCDFL
jgi:hypothetical protein